MQDPFTEEFSPRTPIFGNINQEITCCTNYFTATQSLRTWRASKIEVFTFHVRKLCKENECVCF